MARGESLNQRNEFIEWLDRKQNEGLLGLMDKGRAPYIQSKCNL